MTETELPSSPSAALTVTGEVPRDLYYLTALEAAIDATRFRFEALSNDLAQEVPAGARRSMATIIADMRRREEQFNRYLRKRDVTEAERSPFFRATNAFDDLGRFLTLRQDTLSVLRRLPPHGWDQKLATDEGKERTISAIVRELAQFNADALDELTQLRATLTGATVPGTGSRHPDRGRDLPAQGSAQERGARPGRG